jgi:hypothetical protein
MWQTDTITLQTKSSLSSEGVITNTWSTSSTVLCDVQDIGKELAFRKYGIDINEGKEVYDTTNATWTKGFQVSFESEQYWVMAVSVFDKMGVSNHTKVLLDKVIV